MPVAAEQLSARVAVVAEGDDDGNFKVRVDFMSPRESDGFPALLAVFGMAGLSHGDAVARAESCREALAVLGVPEDVSDGS